MMRDENEVQRAHDILVAIILGETPPIPMDEITRRSLHAAGDTLCWVLGHEHNPNFAENLAQIELALAKLGGGFVKEPS